MVSEVNLNFLFSYQDEKERIEALGGCVVYFGAWRVNGNLSVSRAIGDVEHKPYISGEPCVSEFTLEGNVYAVIPQWCTGC